MIIAVDTGGTKTLIEAFTSLEDKQFVAKFATPHSIDEYVSSVVAAINHHLEKSGDAELDTIAVALPGPLHGDLLLRSTNLGWSNVDIGALLGPHFPGARIMSGNDADIAGLGEARMLAEIPRSSLYLTFSTGVGSGLCHDGRLSPATAVLEAGSMRLPYEGRVQRWEDFASGKNFYERYGLYGSDVPLGDERWIDFSQRIAAGLQVLIPIFKPDITIIGGSMGTHFTKYEQPLTDALDMTIPSSIKQTRICQAMHPEEAVIYGCYFYATDTGPTS